MESNFPFSTIALQHKVFLPQPLIPTDNSPAEKGIRKQVWNKAHVEWLLFASMAGRIDTTGFKVQHWKES